MLDFLERQTTLTGNQRRIIAAAILGDMLEFFDYFLIGYVVAFIAGPWKLTFGRSAVILLASGFGLMVGAVFYGWLADKIGRRKVFLITVANFSLATGILAFTPDNAWLFLSVFRFIIGIGAGGLYCVDLPLVQEFVPASKRGIVGGLVTASVPVGILLGALLGATVTPYVGWRGLFAIGTIPGLLTFLIRAWVPESPRWLLRMGRTDEARRSLAWALEMNAADLPASTENEKQSASQFSDIFRYPRSLAVTWITNLGAQTGYNGFLLWAPTLLVQLLAVTATTSLIPDDFCQSRGATRTPCNVISVGRNWSQGLGWHLWLWLGNFDRRGRFVPPHFPWNDVAILADVDRDELFCRWRVRHSGSVFGRGVALITANNGYGLSVWLRWDRKGNRTDGTRANCWLL
jgi:MFS family permease